MINNLSEKFSQIFEELEIDCYDAIVYGDIPADTQEKINSLNLMDILTEQMGMDDLDLRLVTFILNRMRKLNDSSAIQLCLDNIDKLYPLFKVVFNHINTVECLYDGEKKS